MALDHFSINPQRLLPTSVEDRLLAYSARAVGAALFVAAALGWLALLTWSINDPSLAHSKPGPVRNLLGGPGATVSDLLTQTLGLAAVFALLAPTVWGLELMNQGRLSNARMKLGLFPVSVLAMAGAFAAFPVPSGWPLHHALGGILGDVMYTLASNGLALINPQRAGLVAGLGFFGIGCGALTHSVGLSLQDIGTLVSPPRATSASRSEPSLDSPRKPWSFDWRQAISVQHLRHPSRPDLDPMLQTPPHEIPQPGFHLAPYPGSTRPHTTPGGFAAHGETVTAGQNTWTDQNREGLAGRPQAFEVSTDAQSRAIAERFAPPSADLGNKPSPPRATGLLGAFTQRRAQPSYRRPSLNLLKRASPVKLAPEFTQTVLRGNARLLEDVLVDFGVKGEVKDIKPGPVVTLFELEPARGTKASRVIGLADDIARSMSATSARVAVVPGRSVIGIELPNVRRETVLLRELLEADAFRSGQMALPLALGKSIGGDPVLADLARMPHLLVAGTTGSGKSVGVNAMILSLLYRLGPDECRLLMIDPKMLELSIYNGIPHLLTPVVTDPARAVAALEWAVREMEERYKKMSQLGVRSIDIFNNRVRNAKKRGEMLARTVQTGFDAKTGKPTFEHEPLPFEPLPYIVIVVDEFADLMMIAGKEIEAAIQRLAQMARAAGIHLIMATQRPSVDIVTGTIKANFPTRIAFRVASKVDSRTILEDNGAEQLLGQGDMLFAAGGGQPVRVHGAFVADEEVEAIAAALREQGEPAYVDGICEPSAATSAASSERNEQADEVYDRAVATVLRDRKASTSYIQRRLGIGYNRAADLIERMERDGLIGAADHTGRRDVLVGGDGVSRAAS